jgi:starch-binding outer membrane protein, SusD/RagB family
MLIMKSVITKYKFLFIVCLGLLACNKKLDVKPQDTITPDQIKTEADLTALLLGTYDGLQYYRGYGEYYQLMSDFLANESDIDFVGTFADYRLVYRRQQNRTSTIAEGLWANAYEIINRTNVVLDKIDLVSEDNRPAIEAEAKFIRAIVYYNLSGFYGKPYSDGNLTTNLTVPLILEPVLGTDDVGKSYKARATVQEMYTQIETDLNDAVDGLPEDNGTRADKYTAYAFLSRLYMAEARYTDAATAANAVISSGNYSLTATFAAAFNNVSNSSEDIFGIQQTEQSNTGTSNNGIITMYNAYSDGRGDVQVNDAHLNLYEAGDERGSFFENGENIAGSKGLYTLKYTTRYKVVPVVRLAEMYLTRGEANLRGGVLIGGVTPLQDINTVRERSGASTLATVTAADFAPERFRELAFEGDKFWTKKRLKLNIGSLPYNADVLVFPIPEREKDVNGLLEQNPGY